MTTPSVPWSPGRSAPRRVASSPAVDPQRPTGLMVKEHRGGTPWRVRYYRDGSAASRIVTRPTSTNRPSRRREVLHLTGITPALGPAAGHDPAGHRDRPASRHSGVLRCELPVRRSGRPSRPRRVLAELSGAVDLLFAGPEEAALVLGLGVSSGPSRRRRRAPGPGTGQARPRHRRGEAGALGLAGPFRRPDRPWRRPSPSRSSTRSVPAMPSSPATSAHWSAGSTSRRRACAMGNRLGGAVCEVPGDWEGLPTRDELNQRDSPGGRRQMTPTSTGNDNAENPC